MKSRRKPTSSALRATAYHEAGHALANDALGFKNRKVSIVSDAESTGRVEPEVNLRPASLTYGDSSPARLGRWHNRIIVFLAGREAQRKFNPRSIRSYMSRSDLDKASKILERLHTENSEYLAARRYLETRTRNLIRRGVNWGKIEDLADALIEKRTLDGEQVRRIFVQSVQDQMREARVSGLARTSRV